MPFLCFKCKKDIPQSPGQTFGRSDRCPSCQSDVKACFNCKHYSSSARWECGEEISEDVREKDRANFCEFFQPRQTAQVGGPTEKSKDDLFKKADALFKKS